MTNIDYPASADVQFAYDALNRLKNMVDEVGTTKFTYSAAGQLLTEDGPFASDTVTSIYWNRMRTNLSLAQPVGAWMNTFGYSTTHRLNSVTSPAGAFTYNYSEPSTRLDSLSLPNGALIWNSVYDAMSRLKGDRAENGKAGIGQIGKAAGCAAIGITIFDGFFDLGLLLGCALSCAEATDAVGPRLAFYGP